MQNFMMPSTHLGKSMGSFAANELPSMAHRLAAKEMMVHPMPTAYKFPYVGYDHYLHESAVEKPVHSMHSLAHRNDDQDLEHAPSTTTGIDSHYMTSSEVKYEDPRQHSEAAEQQQSQQQQQERRSRTAISTTTANGSLTTCFSKSLPTMDVSCDERMNVL
ncbi:hypothetical protein PINS_up023085 [Pythium insidiosum]|nr:hypothetical protein PINS_up023085 [Pythium insidiosum]